MGLFGDLVGFLVTGGGAAGVASAQKRSLKKQLQTVEAQVRQKNMEEATRQNRKRTEQERVVAKFSKYKKGYLYNLVGEFDFLHELYCKEFEKFKNKYPVGSMMPGKYGGVVPVTERDYELPKYGKSNIESIFEDRLTIRTKMEWSAMAREWAAKNGFCPSNAIECIWPGWNPNIEYCQRADWTTNYHSPHYNPENYNTNYRPDSELIVIVGWDNSPDSGYYSLVKNYRERYQKEQDYYNSQKKIRCAADDPNAEIAIPKTVEEIVLVEEEQK